MHFCASVYGVRFCVCLLHQPTDPADSSYICNVWSCTCEIACLCFLSARLLIRFARNIALSRIGFWTTLYATSVRRLRTGRRLFFVLVGFGSVSDTRKMRAARRRGGSKHTRVAFAFLGALVPTRNAFHRHALFEVHLWEL